MGACASKFKELKEASDAPPPVQKEEVAFRELSLVEEIVDKDDAPAAAADNEVKHQSLGHLFKESEGEKVSADNTGKTFEEVKHEGKPQESGSQKSPQPIVDAPAKDETEKLPEIGDVKTKPSEERKSEHENSASQNVQGMDKKPEIQDEEKTKTEESLAETTKLEASETKKDEQINLAVAETTKLEASENKKTDEKKPASDAEEKKTEEKPTEASKTESSEKIELKQVVELLEKGKTVEKKPEEKSMEVKQVVELLDTEKPVEKKPDEKSVTVEKSDTTETKKQNAALDAKKPEAGEEKAGSC